MSDLLDTIAYTPVRATDPETTRKAWEELKGTYSERLKRLYRQLLLHERGGLTYRESALLMRKRGTETSSELGQLEMQGRACRLYENGKPAVRKLEKKQKVMISIELATPLELERHRERVLQRIHNSRTYWKLRIAYVERLLATERHIIDRAYLAMTEPRGDGVEMHVKSILRESIDARMSEV